MSTKKFTDEKTLDLVQKSLEHEKKGSKFRRSVARFLVDFNVLSYTIAFLIAFSFQGFLRGFIRLCLSRIVRENKYEVLTAFLTFLVILILCYVFVQFIFYKFIYTEDVEKESVLRDAISTKKKETAKKELEKEPEARREIKKGATFDIKESLANQHHYYPF
jgi:hypothetical protein